MMVNKFQINHNFLLPFYLIYYLTDGKFYILIVWNNKFINFKIYIIQ